MPRPLTTSQEVERLLKEAGIAVRPPSPPGKDGSRTSTVRFLHRLRLRLIWLSVLVLIALLAQFWVSMGAAGDPAGPRALTSDPRFGVVEAFASPQMATTLGVGWERIPFWWKEVQKSGLDSWDPFATGHDATIDAEAAAGRHLVGLLINTPDWAAAHPADHGASVPRGLYLPFDDPGNYWGHFVGLMAKHYAGRIDDWIIWNEVNIPSGKWHTWDGSVEDYAQLVKVAYLAVKAANPNARIILAGDPYWYDHGAFFTQLLKLLTADHQHAGYFDVANLHLYSRPSDMATVVTWYRQTMSRFGLHKPIWIGETNAVPYDDMARPLPRGNFYASLDDQASFIVQAFAIDLAMGVQRIEVNRMLDGSDVTAGGEPFGLVRNDGTVRPAFYAYRTVVNLFSGVTGGRLHLGAAAGIDTVTLEKPGATITVVWDQRPAAATARIPAGPGTAVYDKFGEQLPIRPQDGALTLHLAGSTDNTNSADPRDYVVGGSPLIVVQ